MRTYRQFIEEEIEREPEFTDALREADAELELALQLAEAREAQGISQQDLAIKLGIRQPAISRYERAGRTPSITTALRFADALGVAILLSPGFKVRVVRCREYPLGRSETTVGTPPVETRPLTDIHGVSKKREQRFVAAILSPDVNEASRDVVDQTSVHSHLAQAA